MKGLYLLELLDYDNCRKIYDGFGYPPLLALLGNGGLMVATLPQIWPVEGRGDVNSGTSHYLIRSCHVPSQSVQIRVTNSQKIAFFIPSTYKAFFCPRQICGYATSAALKVILNFISS